MIVALGDFWPVAETGPSHSMGGEGGGRASQIYRVVACHKVGSDSLLVGAGSQSLPCPD
jgi:hypothetical protein